MLQGIIESIDKATAVQDRFNGLSPERRAKAFLLHSFTMHRIITKHRLSCLCTDCNAIMDSFRPFAAKCEVCGSANIVSEYYC